MSLWPLGQMKNVSKNLNQSLASHLNSYGNNKENNGFTVSLPPELLSVYENDTFPHITASLAEGAKAANTKNLNFFLLANLSLQEKLVSLLLMK